LKRRIKILLEKLI